MEPEKAVAYIMFFLFFAWTARENSTASEIKGNFGMSVLWSALFLIFLGVAVWRYYVTW